MGVIGYIFTVALFSFGWCNLFNENMIFGRVGAWLNEHLPEQLAKPLYDCPICNAVWVAVVMYFTIWPPMVWWQLPLIALSASGVNSIIIGFQNKLEDIADGL